MKLSSPCIVLVFFSLILLTACSEKVVSQTKPDAAFAFAKGADISWLPQMEATGYIFYSDQGIKEDCFKIL
jgi:arabinogalactan endo-1,4-beta-galactosidase